MRRSERPFRQLPVPLLGFFLVAICSQILFHYHGKAGRESGYQALTSPLQASTYRGIAMGSGRLLSRLLAIRLQLHDNQMGRHFNYDRIDYELLVEWLQRISEVDPRSEYPMMLAARIYSQTRDEGRMRLVLEFIERGFDQAPQLHWRRLTEASLLAKHGLGDLNLALRLAEKLARQPAAIEMPPWARDMRFLLLADMNEFESAIAIIEAMLQTDAVKDPDEKRFLQEKLLAFQQKLFESRQPATE